MIKYCLEKWDKNKTALEKEIRTNYKKYMTCKYIELVKAVVKFVLNDENNLYCIRWDEERIHEIDDGQYSGTLIYLIPTDDYVPSESDYLITFVGYGSCSGCDTLLHLQSLIEYDALNLTEGQIKKYMQLCKDIVMNIRKPFNIGWRYDERFDEVKNVQGYWKGKPICGYSTVRCSVCDFCFDENAGKWAFCPNCGAEMSGADMRGELKND